MTAATRKPTSGDIEDVQGSADTRRIAISKVRDQGYPPSVRVPDHGEGEQHHANFNMYVYLPQ